MENLQHWKVLARPPQSALKPIKAGRLAGKTDINPQWRYMAMTEHFGPVGIGWKYTVDRTWTEQGADGEVMAFAHVSVYIKDGEKWSDAIPGVGGSTLIAKEKGGFHNSDEAFKMAITDALSVALKMLGVGADIYMGMFDGAKYSNVEPERKPEQKPVPATRQEAPKVPNAVITDAEWEAFAKLVETANRLGVDVSYSRTEATPEKLNGWKAYLTQEINKRKGSK